MLGNKSSEHPRLVTFRLYLCKTCIVKMYSFVSCVLAILLFCCTLSSKAQVVINEIMAANSSVVADPDFGEYADWIELYNASTADVDLSGCFLTDNISDSSKWQIPGGTFIPANGYLLFWADGEDVGSHCSFKLSSIGEEVALYDTNLLLLDSLTFSSQQTNISFGRSQDASITWSWFSESTPGSSNNASLAFEGILYYPVFFSQTGGFFSTQQSVTLTSLGGTIHYTLDGRAPTINDPIYSTPIEFNTSTFIRARVFSDGFIPGPIITHSYFFDNTLEQRGLPVVSLVTDPDYFWDPEIGIYVQDFKPEWEQPLNIELFENDGNNQAVFSMMAGVKVNGLYSWQLPQKMLGIYCRSEYGSNSLDYPLFADRDRDSYDEFILRASGSDWSFTLFRDGLCQSLIQENAFVQKQGFRASIVFINGEYMGVHNIRSRSNGEDIEQLYGLASGEYDIINNDGEIEDGDDVQYQHMDSLFNDDLTIPEKFQLLDQEVDLKNFADYWITEIWASNGSWGHNTKLWKPHGFGKWQFLYGDLDRGFTGSSDDPISNFSVPQGNADDYVRNWHFHLLQNDGYKDFFAQRFADHVYTTFHPLRVNSKIDLFEAPLVPEISYHVDRWTGTTSSYGNGISTVQFWQDQVNALRTFAQERQGFVMNDLKSTFSLNDFVELGTSSYPSAGGSIKLNEFNVPDSPWSGPYFKDMTFDLSAIPNPGYEFVGWSEYGMNEIFSLNSSWRFLDNGSNAGTSWTQIEYDDSSWLTGNAELGYGDGDEATTVSFGPNSNDKFITTYFRKPFAFIGDNSQPISALIKVRRDDGVIVYHNGVEIGRNNMPDGEVNFQTTALATMSNSDESDLIEFPVQLQMTNGVNVIAVEVHQINGQSSDLSFDASLSLMLVSDVIISTDSILTVTLNDAANYAARYIPTGACILTQEIAQNTTLTIDCSPYIASGDTYVNSDVTLSIDPGVQVWFPQHARLIVNGDLQAIGTENNPILFKANQAYGADSWGNISFQNSTALNRLHFTELRDATSGEHPIHNRAAISCWFSEVELDHVTLTENFDNPIFGEYSAITLTNSIIHSPVTGDLINVKYGEGYISDCVFIGNNQPDTDAIDYDRVVDGVIRNSVVRNLHGSNSDGFDIGEESENVLIENCLIHDCTDKGISVGQSSTVNVLNSTIVNCNLGFGIKDLGEVALDHVTLYSNVFGVSCFEKNPGFGGGFASINNTILSNCSTSPISTDDYSIIESVNCFYDTDTMPGESSFWMNPLFINPTAFNFQLQLASPAINAASDGLDLGTLDHSFVTEPRIMISNIQYANSINPDHEFIAILNSTEDEVDLSNYTISEAIDFTFPQGTVISPGEKIMIAKEALLMSDWQGQLFQWSNGQLNNNGEMILIRDQFGIVIDHVLYDDLAPWPIVNEALEHIQLISSSLDNHFALSWTNVLTNDVAESAIPSMIQAFPNPANDKISFYANQAIKSLELFNSSGQIILQISDQPNFVSFDVQALPDGIYHALVNAKDHIRFVVAK
jgi:hypothetical protein